MRKYRIDQFVFHSKSRRRGQALLLSVLIMIFIVLLGTTFIAIVASNMSNTARTGSKDEARQAAKAGIEFADSELTGSDAGLDWRPTYSLPSGTFYYTSFDHAQGWNIPFFTSQTGSVGPSYFVKYPNPQGASPSNNSANFMIRVSQVQANELPDNADNTKTGDIRIESIGFANDDPTAYYKIVAYKSGSANNPLTAAMRSVSNWDWTNNTVPQGTVDSSGTSTDTSLVLDDTAGTFEKGDYVTVWDPTSNMVGNGIVSNVASGSPTTISVSSIGFTPSAGAIVQKAATLGAPSTLDFDNDATTTATNVDYRVSGINNLGGSAINSPGSVWVNGGLVWFGNSYTSNLIAPSAATAINPASYLKVSGVFASSAGAQVQATGTGVTTDTAIPTSSADSTYTTNPTVTNGLVDDGVNRLRGSLIPTRQIQNFTPPDITAGGDGFGRYRQLTQYSTSTDPANPQASAYGYGQGIYINNPTDVEKAGSTPMTQTQLHDLWFTPGTVPTTNTILATSYERSQVPALPASTSNSLEEQHMRGWVSPDQFLPRGAEVIINADNTITVNLDPLDDNSTTYPKANFASSSPTPNPMKGWKNADGSLAGDATNGGVYSHTYTTWPVNGTIFAEGNIRIRGVDANAPSSLTVVSMNNIYIDGSLKLGNGKKVLLLAKKNVIVNPTLTLQPIQAVTTLSTATTGSATQNWIDVYDLSNMKAGDYVSVAGTNYLIVGKSTNTGPGRLTLNRYLPTTVRSAGTVVQTVFDPRTDIGSYTSTYYNRPYTTAVRLSRDSNVIQRRVQWPDVTTNIRLAFRHSAEYRKALDVDVIQAVPNPPFTNPPLLTKASLTNKIDLTATSPKDLLQVADKALTITYSENPPGTPDPGTDTFPATPPVDQATAATFTLDDLVSEMQAKRTAPNWNYGSTATPATKVDTNYATATKQPLYYFLASSGSRYPFPAQYTPQPTSGSPNPYPPASEPSKPIYPQPSSGVVDIPMATSVWTLLNNVQTPLSLIPGLDIVNQFGFSPIFIDSTTPQNEAEDILTTDQYFYQPHATTAPDATYPYYYPGVQNLTGAYTSNYAGQIKYDTDAQYTLDSRTLEASPIAGSNEIVLQQNDATVGTNTVQYYFTNKTSPTDTSHYPMPFYRLSNLKLQNESFDSSTPPNLDQMDVGTTFDINAYVYAQEGGWYVIPGSNFDSSVKNNDDLDRDGVISQGESVAAYRYHRYNYQIVFTGAIMENQTATASDVGDWTDKWATVKMTVPTAAPTYDSKNPATSNFNDILYFYDPTAAQGFLNTDVGFHEPVASGLIYQG